MSVRHQHYYPGLLAFVQIIIFIGATFTIIAHDHGTILSQL